MRRGRSACSTRTAPSSSAKAADLCLWDVDHPAELAYAIGASPLRARFHNGRQHPLQ